MDTKLSFKNEKGFVRIELEVDTASSSRRDSLISHASTRIHDAADRYSDDGPDSSPPLSGGSNPTILAQAVDNLGHIVARVDDLAEVGFLFRAFKACRLMID